MARQLDLAFWVLPSSAWPDIVEQRTVEVWTLPVEVIQAVMREHGEAYVFKAAVNLGTSSLRWYWHVRLSESKGLVTLPVSVGEVVKQVWMRCEENGVEPVAVSSRDALGLARAQASREPGGVVALWCQAVQGAGAQEVRAFVDGWNGRRSLEVRYRLLLDMDREQSKTRR